MKKLLKFFGLICLLFTDTFNCKAVRDCRFIKNQAIVEAIKNQNHSEVVNEDSYVEYRSIIFMVNEKNISKVMTAAPILKIGGGIIGEVITEVTIENANKVQDILEEFTLSSSNNLTIKLHEPSVKFFESYGNSLRYVADNFLLRNLKPSIKEYGQIFYIAPRGKPDDDFQSLNIAYVNSEGVSPIEKRFAFNYSNSPKKPPVVEIPRHNAMDCLRNLFNRPKKISTIRDTIHYDRLD